MKKYIFLLLFVLCCSNATALLAQTSTPARLRVSILTCDAGEDIYTAWGHTAIRIVDSVNGTDYVFNYGTFDFNTPFFITKFIKGSLNYFMSANSFPDFYNEYQFEKRDIKEQVLHLSTAEKEKWYAALRNNMVGDNRFYLYNFISDNCTTRIKNGLIANTSFSPVRPLVNTYREKVIDAPYRKGIPWIGLGIDLLLGAYSDQKPNDFQAAFLPDLLYEQNDRTRKLVESTATYHFNEQPVTNERSQLPFQVLIGFFIFYFFAAKTNTLLFQRIATVIDVLLMLVWGIGGTLIFYMSFMSMHTACYQNYNIMWMQPLYVLALIFYFVKNKFIGKLGLLFMGATVALLISQYWLPQHFSKEIFILIGITMVLNYRFIQKGRYAV